MTVKGLVAAGILPAVEPGFPARRQTLTHYKASRRFREPLKNSGALSGRQGCAPSTATTDGCRYSSAVGSALICGARPSGRFNFQLVCDLKRAEARAPIPSSDTAEPSAGLTLARKPGSYVPALRIPEMHSSPP